MLSVTVKLKISNLIRKVHDRVHYHWMEQAIGDREVNF